MQMAPAFGRVQIARKQLGSRVLPSSIPGWAARQTFRVGQTDASRQFALGPHADSLTPAGRRRQLPLPGGQDSGDAPHLDKPVRPTLVSSARAQSRYRGPNAAESSPRLYWAAVPRLPAHWERRSLVWSHPRCQWPGCHRRCWQKRPGFFALCEHREDAGDK